MMHLIMIFVTILDIPTLITLGATFWAKKPKHVLIAASVAAIIGEIIVAVTMPSYEGPNFIVHRLVGQLIVGFGLYVFLSSRRRKKAKALADIEASKLKVAVE